MTNLSFALLRSRNFRFLLSTRALGVMALQCQAIIVGWQIYSLTKSTFMLGLTGLTEAVPAISCALFAGHFVDTRLPIKVYRSCVGILAINTFMLFLIGGGHISAPGASPLPYIYAGIFISGLARSFIMPASFSILPKIVTRAELPAASAWMSSAFQLSAVGGPAIAGLVYGGYGPSGAWLLPVSCFVLSFIMVCSIDTSTHIYTRSKTESMLKSIRSGWRFILQNSVLLSVMALDMFAVLLGGAVSMLPAYADRVLHVGSEGLGALRAAPALGAVIIAVFLAINPMKRVSALRMLWVVAGFGLCIIGFGLSKIFWLSLAFLAVSGAFDNVSVVIRSTLMQLLTTDEMRGRVSSVNSMFIISSNEIGSFESGTMAQWLGLVPSVVFGGIGTLVVVAVTALASPKLRRTVVDTDHSPSST